MARETGLEPATSTVTGWHSNQLSYAPAISCMKLNIHPGFGKSKLKLEKSTKKLSRPSARGGAGEGKNRGGSGEEMGKNARF